MREHLRLGRIAGVDVGINWSVLIIFGLITFGLATGGFPLLYPGAAAIAYAIGGLTAGTIFFLSLLAHELSHAIVARRNGVAVEGITLWLFGGVARLAGDAPNPGAELRIAVVGPLVSVIVSAAFLTVAILLGLAGVAELVVGVFAWLSLINLVLAVFNLVPAAPLDGGRLLRAILWWWHGDRQRAAVTSANAGQIFGGLLIAVGLWILLVLAGWHGLWFMLLGWFLINAASAEAQHARLQTTLGDLTVGEVMSPHPITAPPTISVEDFLERFVFTHRFSTFPLAEESGRFLGLVTLDRIKRLPAAMRATTPVHQLACPPTEVATAAPDEPLTELVPRLQQCADHRAVVIDQDHVVGVVSPVDMAQQLILSEIRASVPAERPVPARPPP